MTLIGHFHEMPPHLRISFKKTAPLPLDYQLMILIRHAIKATLEYEGVPNDAEVSFTCCTNEDIRRLNCIHRNIDKPTDVLSFPLYADRAQIDSEKYILTLGDIVVSYERAEEQAAELGHSTEREIAFLTIHSVLHLLGYDHERSTDEDDLMCQKQRDILALLLQQAYTKEQ